MNVNGKLIANILLIMLLFNIISLTIPIENEDFFASNNIRVELLGGSRLISNKKENNYHIVPRLTSTSQNNLQSTNNITNGIRFSWAEPDWNYKKNITILASKVSANLINFPVLIDIYDSDLQNDAQASGNDIIFTNEAGTQLDHEIELFDPISNSTHAHLIAWVKTNLSSSQNTILSMYYGNPVADNQENPSAVWDDNYVGVWHLGETTGSATDSTSYGINGTISGGVIQNITGQVGRSYDFDGIAGTTVNFGDPVDGHLDFGISSFTVSFWVNIDQSTTDYQMPLYKGGFTNGVEGYEFETSQDGNHLTFYSGDDTQTYTCSCDTSFDTWYYIVGVNDRSTDYIRIYQNSVNIGSTDISSLGSVDSVESLVLSPNSYPFDGMIDEVRLSKSIRSFEWIQTEHANQDDPKSFYSVGTQEKYWFFPTFAYRKDITIDATKVSGNLTNFPVLISQYDADLHGTTKVQSSGADILFADASGTQLNHEIELFDQTGNGTHANLVAWVKANLSSTENVCISMYYGNSTLGNQENPTGVWDSNFKMVHHFDETTGTTSYDSTSNNEDGTIQGSPTLAAIGKIGNSYQFNDASESQRVRLPSLGTLDAFTMEIWANPSTGEKEAIWGREFDISGNTQGTGITYATYDPKVFGAHIPDGSEGAGATRIDIDAESETSVNVWNHIVITYNGSTLRMYVNGAEVADSPKTGMSSPNYLFTSNHYFAFTGYNWELEEWWFDGKLDEAHLSDIARNTDWIFTEYNNQYDPSNFYSVGEEQVKEGVQFPPGEYYVDNSISNVDSSGDLGSLLDFTSMKAKDTNYANLQETNAASVEWIDSFETVSGSQSYQSVNWWTDYWIQDINDDYNWSISDAGTPSSNTGASAAQQGTWFIYTEASTSRYGNFNLYTANSMDFSSLSNEKIEFYWNMIGNNIDALYLEENTSGSWSSVWNQLGAGSPDQFSWNFTSVDLSGLSGTGFLRFRGVTSIGYAGDICLDNVNITGMGTVNYRLDQEIQWTNVPYEFAVEELCLDVGSIDTEDLNVEVWDGDDWVQVFNDLIPYTWNNISIAPYLNSSTFTVRFIDGTQSSDNTTQDEWQIDAALIRVGNDETPPVINDFGVEDLGTGTGLFWANITDTHSSVESAIIKINNTEYSMTINGTYWVKQLSINFNGSYLYQISNTSDIFGNALSTPSNNKTYTFTQDKVTPDVLDWEYYEAIGPYGTFKANVSDSWGIIATVIINVTYAGGVNQSDLWAVMALTASGYMNDTLILPSGTIKYVVTVNDTAGNFFTSSEHQGLVPSTNQPPSVANVTLSRSETAILLPILSNDTLYLDYDYDDPENDEESGTEIRWYKNGIHQPTYDDQKQVPTSVLVKGDAWNATVTPSDGQVFGILVASPLIMVQNTPPHATSVGISPSTPVTTSTLSVSYIYSDYDGDSQNTGNRKVCWYKEGVLQPTLNDSVSISSGLTHKGEEWYYTLRVHDGTNYSAWLTSSNVIIANSAPSATSVDISPSTPLTGDTLNANYTFSDVDGDSQSGSLIRWYKNGILQGGLNDSPTIDSSLTLKGENWYFTVQPSDGIAYGTLKQSAAVVITNTAPNAEDLEIIPNIPYTVDSILGNYSYTDVDNDLESGSLIIWYKDGVLQNSLNGSSTVDSSHTSKGEVWHFKIRPSDGTDDGFWYSCPVNVTIGNTAPSISNLVINPSTPDTIDNLFVTYDYFDSDMDPESDTEIHWYMNGSLQSQFTNFTLIQSGNTTKGQIWHVKLRVFDGTSFSTWVNLLVNTTIINSPPIVSDVRLNEYNGPTQISDMDELVASYIYFDSDDDLQINVSREIFWYKKNQSEYSFILQGHLNNSLIVGSDNTSVGDTWYFIIRVFDGTDYSSYKSSPSVSIGVPPNSPPEAQFLNLTPAIPITTDTLYINWTFVDSDINDNESGSLYYWYRNGIHMPEYDSLRTLPAFATAKGDVWHVKVRPRDGIDFGQLVSVPINITIENSAPEASTLLIYPAFPVTGSELGISYVFFDIDSDSEAGSDIIWYINGVLEDSLNGSIVVTPSNTIKGQEWHFKLRPKDGSDYGTWTSCPVNITIGNTAPAASSLTVIPVNPKTEEDLIANYLFADPDAGAGDVEGNSLICWFKNGIEQISYENQTIIPNSATHKGENWWFEVTPFDGTDFGTKKTSTLINIKNTAPSAINLQFNPSEPITGTDLLVSYSYNDVDGDPEGGAFILWFRNGILESTYTDMNTVDGTVLVKDDLWNVSIQVSDGTDFSIWINGSILIANTPPTITTDSAEIFEPSSGLITTSSLIALWDAYDADGDPIIDYKITWENRSSGSGLFIEQLILENLTEVPSLFTSKNQDWRFKIQIFDGITWSIISVSFLATIENSEPVVDNIIMSGGQTTTDPITVTYDFYDADGDPDQSEILWGIFHITIPFIFIGGTHTLSSSAFAAGDLIWVEITPDDDDISTGQGEPIDTSKMSGVGKQIQVGNSAPQINTTLGFPTILSDHPDGTTLFTAGYSLYVDYAALVYDIDSGESTSLFDISLANNEDISYSSVSFVVGSQYRWYKFNSVTGNFELQPALTDMMVYPYYLHRDEQYMVSVRPRDNYGYYGSWVNSTPISIGNSYPQILGFQWIEAYPTTAEDLSFSFIYFDYDGDPLDDSQTLIIWYKNGFVIPGTANQTILSSTNFIKGDSITVTFRPFDGINWAGRSYNSTEFVGTLIIINSPPIATNVILSPFFPTTLDQLVLNWTFTDADNDSESFLYLIEWRRSGVIIPQLENMTVIPSSYTSKGETWQARIWLFDGEDYSYLGYSSNEEDVIIIQNSLMEITGILFSGIESQTIANIDLQIEWNISDADNDGQIDYEIYWYCDKGSASFEYISEYGLYSRSVSSSDLIKSHSWYCIVKVNDGTDWSTNVTSPIILIINAAPEATDLYFVFNDLTSQVEPNIRTNEFYVEDENISIFFNYYDLDNDVSQIKIQWFKITSGSILEMSEFENASIIPSEGLTPGEQWFCCITPYDGFLTGNPINSSLIPIYSRPVCYHYDIKPDTSSEGIYRISASVTDISFGVNEVQFNTLYYDNSSKIWFASKSLGNNWTLLFELDDLSYLNTNIIIEIKCLTSVSGTDFEIYSTYSLEFLLEDKAPPRVMDAYFDWNNKRNPTNLTFEAVIQEFGSGISQVELYYYFSPAEDSEGNGASVGHISSNQVTMTFKQYNTTENYYIYEITVNFIHNNSDTDIIYWIATTDNAGNTAPLAFDIREDHQRIKEQRFIYTPPGLPQEILLIAGLMICIIFIGAVVYVRFIRKPELVGLDKELVLNKISEVSEEEVNESVDQHTIGIVISFFDQRHGPIPIIIAPELLRDNFNKLVELSDRSFSGTGFSDNFEIEIPSSYDFVLDHGIRTSILSFGFALKRPDARGGQENLTLNILVHQEIFPLVQSFQKSIQQKIHKIHLTMDDESTEKSAIRYLILDLRKYISYIILSYKNIYGTTELLEEDGE